MSGRVRTRIVFDPPLDALLRAEAPAVLAAVARRPANPGYPRPERMPRVMTHAVDGETGDEICPACRAVEAWVSTPTGGRVCCRCWAAAP